MTRKTQIENSTNRKDSKGNALVALSIYFGNIVKDTKKKRKDSDNVVKSSLLSNGEESDTMSMLVKPSSEWVPTSFVNITSLMHSSGGYTQKSCCCRKKKKKVFF